MPEQRDDNRPDESPAAPLTLAQAQAAVDASIRVLGGYWPPLANLARLFEECGELARAVNQAHGPKRLKEGETPAAARDELGDVLYVLLVLANSLDLDASAALDGALARARQRTTMPASEWTDDLEGEPVRGVSRGSYSG